ncbi:hypothetical protein [Spiroplasma sp. SV19]|uniref:hypothetical protein n=1 Tax=Spiroplasma sp. SV19 TaxID=2570468 RepID=UPI0024B7167C|nr:hypothetical protein [Spiroplasma sp. SV19]WHQ36814.1 hypothetical protein E7Y35_02775 [Spiroplasma sp. SV19]
MTNTIELIKELNSPTKIVILCWLLKCKVLTVAELEQKSKINRVNISKQICELHCKEIVVREKEGKNNKYYLNPNLNELLLGIIKDVVNSYHIIDENKGENYEKY